MKKVKLIVLMMLCVQLNSCTSEPDLHTYVSRIKNNSTSTIEVKGFDTPKNNPIELVFNETIIKNNQSSDCVETFEAFLGLGCRIDSLVVRFDNGKGYICVVRTAESVGDVNQLCFQDKSPFDIEGFKNLGNNTFEFEITQEDYDHAYDLPE